MTYALPFLREGVNAQIIAELIPIINKNLLIINKTSKVDSAHRALIPLLRKGI
jgi:hypothetical protein